MTGKTHLSFGIAAALTLTTDPLNGVMMIAGAMLPDIDSRQSLLGQVFPFVPKMIKHRTITHCLIFAALCYLLNPFLCYGILMHIILDMMTKQGCPLLYPIKYNVRLPFARFVKTSGKFEGLLFFLITLYNAYLLFGIIKDYII